MTPDHDPLIPALHCGLKPMCEEIREIMTNAHGELNEKDLACFVELLRLALQMLEAVLSPENRFFFWEKTGENPLQMSPQNACEVLLMHFLMQGGGEWFADNVAAECPAAKHLAQKNEKKCLT